MTSIFTKMKPVTYLFTQLLYHNNMKNVTKYRKTLKMRQWPIKPSIFMISAALTSFLWPSTKEEEEELTELTPTPPVLQLDAADNLFENGHYEQCYELLKLYETENNVEIQWRICRVLYNMSKERKYDKSYKQNLMLQAYETISCQLENHEDHYAVHKWYAILLDAKSSLGGVKERIKQLETVKKHMDLAVQLHPKDATILYMLGEWCYQIAELPWHQRKIAEVIFAAPPYSSYEDALEYFLKAEAVQPRFYGLNLLRIGMCYYRLKKVDQAKYYLKLAASYPAKTNDDHTANKNATELLKKLK